MQAGIFTYAWDLEASGYGRVAGELAGAGFTAINLATACHAGIDVYSYGLMTDYVFRIVAAAIRG